MARCYCFLSEHKNICEISEFLLQWSFYSLMLWVSQVKILPRGSFRTQHLEWGKGYYTLYYFFKPKFQTFSNLKFEKYLCTRHKNLLQITIDLKTHYTKKWKTISSLNILCKGVVETLSCPSNSLLPYSCSWDQEQSLRREQEWGSEKEKEEASPGEPFPAGHHLCGQSGWDPSGTFWGVTYTVAQNCPPEEWEKGGSIYSPAPVLIAFHILRCLHVQKLIRVPGIPDTAGETFEQKRGVTRWGWNEGLPGCKTAARRCSHSGRKRRAKMGGGHKKHPAQYHS